MINFDINSICMDVRLEKVAIMKRLEQVHDISLIKAIKNLLDFGITKQESDDIALQDSIKRGSQQAEDGLLTPHSEVMSDLRKKYAK